MPDKIEEIEDDDKKSSSKIKPGPGTMSRKLTGFWLDQIGQYDESRAHFIKKGNDVIKRYRDERSRAEEEGQRRMNMLWANTRIMLPALYSRAPTPIIDRKFLDKDPTGRISAMMAERAVRNEIVTNGYHKSVKAAVLDYLLPGQGQVWVRYEPEFGESTSIPAAMRTSMDDELAEIEGTEDEQEDNKTEKLEDTGEEVERESTPVDYIDWKDFYMLPAKARTWAEVQAVAKKILVSKKEAKERFGEEIGEAMRADTTPQAGSADRPANRDTDIFSDINERSIVIYEIWNKSDRRAYWVSPGYEYLADIRDDPLELAEFFPCPEPLFANPTNDSMVPVPDYMEWQDQAIQIDELTQRIALLTKACKVAGTYNAANSQLRRLLDESVENELIPVDDWAVHAEKGGVAGAISFLPIKEIQSVIETLQATRSQCMQDLDIVTGVNDIMRGTTDSRETLGGIRLKNNNTGTRLSDRQGEVARFARDVIRIVAEIICKKYTSKSLIEASGILYEEELNKQYIKQNIMEKAAQTLHQNQQQAPHAMPPMPQPPPQQGAMQQPGSNVVPFNPQQGALGAPPGVSALQPVQPSPQEQMAMLESLADKHAEEIITQKIEAAIELLRKDIPRRYRIDIEVDSTIYADAAQEREDAVSFIDAFMKFMQAADVVVNSTPEAAPLMGKMLQFGVRKFRSGRDLESAIEDFCEKMVKKAAKAEANPKPDPESMKMQIEQQKAKAQIANTELQGKLEQQNDQRAQQLAAQENQQDMARQAAEDKRAQDMLDLEMRMKMMEAQMKMREMERQEQYKEAEHQRKMHELTHKAVTDIAVSKAQPKESSPNVA